MMRYLPNKSIAPRKSSYQVRIPTGYFGSSDTRARVLFVGSYPPRECGIATFTEDVRNAYDVRQGFPSDVIAVSDEGTDYRYPSCVIGQIHRDVPFSYADAARAANDHKCDIINVQHEYGLFGGDNGRLLVGFLAGLRKPIAITLHTTLPDPDTHMRDVTRELCNHSDTVIVLAETSRRILQDVYGIDARKVKVVLHGAPDVPSRTSAAYKRELGLENKTVLTTFGLLSRGKGIEFILDALPLIFKEHPEATYLLLGKTHPNLRKIDGESYRESLAERARVLGIGDRVRFEDRFMTDDEVVSYLMATDVYVSTSLERSQIVSGTLSYAVACGRVAIATEYMYARELLAEGRGITVPFKDSRALAGAVNLVLGDHALRRSIEANAHRFGRRMTWPRVAAKYEEAFVASGLQTRRAESRAARGIACAPTR